MSARDRILGALRHNADTSPLRDETAVDGRLNDPQPVGPTPAIAQLEGPARLERFIAQATGVHATVARLDALADLPAALSHELRNRNLGPAVRFGTEPRFAALDWSGIDISQGPGRRDEPASLSHAFCGVAETGSLLMLSGPENPQTLNFLGETHFVALAESEIEPGLEAAWARLRASGRNSRTATFVTGPSRTADIEQTLELGAHGPVALHIFLYGRGTPEA